MGSRLMYFLYKTIWIFSLFVLRRKYMLTICTRKNIDSWSSEIQEILAQQNTERNYYSSNFI